MNPSLTPNTAAGRRLVEALEARIPEFFERARHNDQASCFPFQNFEELAGDGSLRACIPEPLGGGGVESVVDLVSAVNRVGRGDGSTALVYNMHLAQVWLLAHYWRETVATGNHAAAAGIERYLEHLARENFVISSTVAEPGTDILHPYTRATPCEHGFKVNGRKAFGTGLPIAKAMQVTCLAESEEHGTQFAIATLDRHAEGVQVLDDWDALGMRASGSHNVVYRDVFVATPALALLGPWGRWCAPYLFGNVVITLGLVAGFLGIAESARTVIEAQLQGARKNAGRRPADRPAVQHTVARMEIDLAAARAMVERTARTTDELITSYRGRNMPDAVLHTLMADFQCTKTFVNERAVGVVDLAMTASGGAGYATAHPLSRLYRDVRAGSFMQPYSPNEAYEYIGRVSLGLEPNLADYVKHPALHEG
ncbi:MAG: acyl-CoA/acyl-ACP dehydrogenase [Gammaproteobacteria bacterium]|nr:acyl-CoA/acyl-ACP dehydrogenase [Gammaproteobacteria bacterium]